MISDVRYRLDRVRFVPFIVRTSDGHDYAVPTVDHAYITPRGNRVVIATDDDATVVLGPLHINALIDNKASAA
jgi:predicted secreted protein